ncbi:hypothetical protein FHW36_10681 [Chitinophaga polysaccharea]|uniref:Uncharacterized protein n=1 Tax=Chitinophaga polysaccharea TaxID=1293035 RepID=A0A561PL68_9BACT|nr:hypothetical protein [Chitinophaga polysaccharea]TWF38858.1 hypothetical protein FHW36_10681 [Chitinophaga polysaccharea]
MTLNNLIDLLRKYAGDHLQINDFGTGYISELGASKDQSYPLMWVIIAPSRYDGKQMNYNLQLIFADLLYGDKKNELEVWSDQLLIALDTLAYLRDNPDFDFQTDGNASVDFFTEHDGDLAAGVILGITINDPKPLDRCVIPF